jgi:hypothetical protein
LHFPGKLTSQCRDVTKRLERLQAKNPARVQAQPLFGISGINEDLQLVYAIELILMRLERWTGTVQAEVADAIMDLMETIAVTYVARKSPGDPAQSFFISGSRGPTAQHP